MGKQQQRTKKDRKAARHNPVRVPDSHLGHGTPAGATHKAKEEAILPIISKVRTQALQRILLRRMSQAELRLTAYTVSALPYDSSSAARSSRRRGPGVGLRGHHEPHPE